MGQVLASCGEDLPSSTQIIEKKEWLILFGPLCNVSSILIVLEIFQLNFLKAFFVIINSFKSFNVSIIKKAKWPHLSSLAINQTRPLSDKEARQFTNWKVNLLICKLSKASNKENWSVQLIRPPALSSWSVQLVRPAGLSSWFVQLARPAGSSSWSLNWETDYFW